jgi:hypothetical protein
MSMTSVEEIEHNRSVTAGLEHVSGPWARDLRIGEAVFCSALGGGT